jgi:predicted ATPase
MIKTLELQDFRGFERHRVQFRPTTLVVGANNAGKSTIVEALRLVSLVANRYRNLTFRDAPDWLDPALAARGVSPSLIGSGINLAAVMHQYRDPPARINAVFTDGAAITIYLGPDNETHAVIRDGNGALVANRQAAYRLDLSSITTQPQVGPVLREERLLTEDTVRRNLSSTLAPTHFRNQLYLLREDYEEFCATAESTWPHFAVDDLIVEGESTDPDRILRLLVRNGRFVGELSLMGHGLQMWLQTVWFLVRSRGTATVILDEPDVYMHPDLQHRLIRFLKGRHPQLIVATHSADILSEVEPSSILVVNAARRESTFANTPAGVQRVIDQMGGIHNLQLARLAAAKRCLLVEGKDISFLKRFQDTMFPESMEPIDTIPRLSIGGWGGWSYAVGSSMMLKNAAGENVRAYCILDSDFHCPELIADREAEAVEKEVELFVWPRKEIENYLLIPTLIYRVILQRIAARTAPPTVAEISEKVDEIARNMRDHVVDQFAKEYYERDRSLGVPAANRSARDHLEPIWTTPEGRLARVPGKRLLSELSTWSNDEFGVSFGPATLASEIRLDELHDDVKRVLRAIEHNEPFVVQ